MASLPSKRIRKVVNYAALEQDTDISDDDDFTGFPTSPKNKAKQPKDASASSCDEVTTSRGKLHNKKSSKSSNLIGNSSDACSEGDDALHVTSRPVAGRSSLQDRVFQRDLAAALELSKTSRLDSDFSGDEILTPPLGTSTPNEIPTPNEVDVLRDLTLEKTIEDNNKNSEDESKNSNTHELLRASETNEQHSEEKENISISSKPVSTEKDSNNKSDADDSDDDFNPIRAPCSKTPKRPASPVQEESSSRSKRRIASHENEGEILARGRNKRSRQKVSFASDSSTDSENEWAESEEEDVDNFSEDSDYEESSSRQKKSKKEIKSLLTSKSKNHNRAVHSTKPKNTKAPLSSDKSVDVKASIPIPTTDRSHKKPLIAGDVNKTEANSKILHNAVESNSAVSRAACESTSISKVTSPAHKPCLSSQPLLARAAFKSPAGVAKSPCLPNTLVKTRTPSMGLRLGLSRKVSVKSLHPNALLK